MSKRSDSYDDEAELTEYIWHNYRQLLTELETRVHWAVMIEEKTHNSSERFAKALRKSWGSQNDSRVVEALKDGLDVFRRRVRDRILGFSANEVFINRCPTCERIVATPKAQQCLWCGHDWHHKTELT